MKRYKKTYKDFAILMPLSSLDSKDGIGDFGPQAYKFVDLISKMKFKIWQILPLNTLGFANSPYQCQSSKAIDEIFISLELLKDLNLIKNYKPRNIKSSKVIYEEVRTYKQRYLKQAFNNFKETCDYQDFKSQEWVKDWALFKSLKNINSNNCWTNWQIHQKDENECEYQIFLQYIAFKQYMDLKHYANLKGIKIMGDIPIYVGIDSDDVYFNRKCFKLDENNNPLEIAGVPPDYFNEDGQRWGNPIYDWNYIEENNFEFWINRLSYANKLYDIIRLDHFIGFANYYSINPLCPTAKDGKWLKAPGKNLFSKIFSSIKDINIVVEDLGELNQSVIELRDSFNLKGMRVLQFCQFETNCTQDIYNCIYYSSTHDNPPCNKWLSDMAIEDKHKLDKYINKKGYKHKKYVYNILELVSDSKASIVVYSILDILNLDNKHRINEPGTLGYPNWQFKLKSLKQLKIYKNKVKKLINKYKGVNYFIN